MDDVLSELRDADTSIEIDPDPRVAVTLAELAEELGVSVAEAAEATLESTVEDALTSVKEQKAQAARRQQARPSRPRSMNADAMEAQADGQE